MDQTIATTTIQKSPYLTFSIQRDFTFNLTLNTIALVVIILVAILVVFIKRYFENRTKTTFEIDQAEMGIGSAKLTFKPNNDDRQIAYKIWVELSTRKIGIPIDLEHDVISEVYDSWYGFFSVTRELIKDIPVSKIQHESTQKVVKLSIAVLNEGLRPHLTTWQARFRHWYEKRLKKEDEFDPQAIQAEYPKFSDLKADMLEVNNRLIKYRSKMKELVLGGDLD